MLDQTKYKNVQAQLAQKKEKQKGASMIEYALVVAAVVGLGALFFNQTDGTITSAMKTKMTTVAGDITGSSASSGTGGTAGSGTTP